VTPVELDYHIPHLDPSTAAQGQSMIRYYIAPMVVIDSETWDKPASHGA
jgi:hypothetical protein